MMARLNWGVLLADAALVASILFVARHRDYA